MFTIIFSYFIIAFVIVNTGNSEASVKRIVGGRPAKSSQWPMMVSVRQQNLPETLKSMNIPYISRNGHFCSGTLISPQWVVTAASCFQDSEVNKLLYGGPFTIKKVYKMISLVRTMVARMNLNQFFVCIKEDCSVWRSIENIIIHPRYLISIGGNKPGYDIALIKLGKPVEDYIPDLLSPSTAVNLSLNCKTAGWGVSDMQNFESSGDFQEFDVKLIPSQLCKPLIKLSEICGIGNLKGDQRSDFCFFDTGGPLICKGDSYDDDWKLLGLISRDLRSDCGDPDQKGIYTNIIGYYNWINSIIG